VEGMVGRGSKSRSEANRRGRKIGVAHKIRANKRAHARILPRLARAVTAVMRGAPRASEKERKSSGNRRRKSAGDIEGK